MSWPPRQTEIQWNETPVSYLDEPAYRSEATDPAWPFWATKALFDGIGRYVENHMGLIGGVLVWAGLFFSGVIPVLGTLTLAADAFLFFGRLLSGWKLGEMFPSLGSRPLAGLNPRNGWWITSGGNPGWGLWLALLGGGAAMITLADLLKTRVLS